MISLNTNVASLNAARLITLHRASPTKTPEPHASGRTTGVLAVSGKSVSSAASAQPAETAVDAAITAVATGRSTFGANAQALDNLKNVLDATGVANQDARSKITDTDVATEVGNLVRQQ